MRASCYILAFIPTFEVLVTKLRVAVISVMSAGLGGIATGGLRLLDSRSTVAAVVGGAAVLSVALVLDAVRFARDLQAMAEDGEKVRRDVTSLHERLDVIEVKIAGITPRTSNAGRTGSFPAI